MTKLGDIIIISTHGCRRSRAMLAYLERQGIPFTHVAAESSEGQALIDQYGLRASPGILVDGVSISPFDLLIPPACQVNQDAARRVFGTVTDQQTRMDTDDKKRARKPKLIYQTAVPIGVALVVAVILILKAQRSSTDASARLVPTTTGSGTMAVQVASPTRAATSTPTSPAKASTATPVPAEPESPTAPPVEPTAEALDAAALAALSPEEQVDRLLAAKQPIFAFFHSTTCKQCIDMTAIVEQVYPDFDGQVYLVDVNVYDKDNLNLLRQANIRVIPTLIFIDHNGEAWGYTGVIPADALRAQLQTLAGGG